ncbi:MULTISPECIES: SRPBCC family protein [Fischerella]|uniref:SRPBCC domain-containing protein n=1 Tax=Fischerella muscicola CCMEE 5323 TaxID=2019572 RepID=A0A2N6K2L2_FISMU|nr:MULTISPECIES: SRPBCC domain-containing protein [Fischerella]MBD2431559.1 SRPBCC domain-containing protein [Fischerella sp. FACHB-380]PLZ89199.1 SRPBCC domain-containing protein [Fischerella muscicola CCMEE 5323]
MLRDLKKEVFYPYPPQRVWQVLTNRHTLAAWLMENDFEPRVGHKFRFLYPSLAGLGESIDCEVIELDEPKRLSFTWQDSMMHRPSIVIWTLKPVDGGTQLQLEHKGLSQEPNQTRHGASGHEQMGLSQPWQGRFMHESTAGTTHTTVLSPIPVGRYEAFDSVILSSFLNGGWDYRLNETMPKVLVSLVSNNK